MTITTDWETAAKNKKKEVSSNIPHEWLLPTDLLEKYNETTSVSVLDLPKKTNVC